jgi:hypothetical protein
MGKSSLRVFKLLLIVFVALVSTVAIAERTFTIGAPSWSGDLNFLNTSTAVSSVYRDLTQSSLLSPVSSGTRLIAAKGVTFISESVVEISLGKSERFSNGAMVTAAAVVDAIGSCPIAVAVGVKAENVSKVKLRLTASNASSEPRKQLIEVLQSCPVDDPRVAQAMGSAYGTGTNVVGLGNFIPIEYRPGRLLAFRGGVREGIGPHSFDRIEVRAVDNPESGLAALRLGNIELLLLGDKGMLAEASRDTTLTTGRCGELDFVARSSVSVPCINGQLKISEVRNG